MRIEIPYYTERFGAVRLHSVQHVFELDSGMNPSADDPLSQDSQTVRHIPYPVINGIERNMAIVVPCKQERLKVLEGVLAGIPHDCLTILVSNSSRRPVDRFQMEREALSQFCQFVQRSAILVHQRDNGLGQAFGEAGFDEILDENGKVRHGKAEGMFVGMTIAKLCGKKYVGFIDADNYVPGAVNEYVKEYAAGFHLAQTPYSMVRISWHSKPKIQGSRLFFNRWGRTSESTNRFLNLLISHYSGFGTEIIKTGNAGEHAFSMDLGEHLAFAGGFSVEPYELIHLLELFGGVNPSPHSEVMEKGVEVFQIETRNPHFHEDKGEDHVEDMKTVALGVLFHSPICPQALKEEILDHMRENEGLGESGSPEKERIYSPLSKLDADAFLRVLDREGESFEQILRVVSRPVVAEPPIAIPESGSSPDSPVGPAGRSNGASGAADDSQESEHQDVTPVKG